MRIEVELIVGIKNLAPWKEAWDELFNQGVHQPSVSFEWTSALLGNHLRANDQTYLLLLKRGEQLVGFLPLIASQEPLLGQTLTTLSPLSERYDTHSDFLFKGEPGDCLSAIFHCLANANIRWDIFRVKRLREQQPLLQQIEDWLKTNSFGHRLQWEPPSFYLELPDSMETYLSLRSGKFRNYLRRVEKKIATLGAVRFDLIQNTIDPEQAYEQLLQVERNSWKHDHGTAISAVAHQTGFYRDLCVGATASGKLHLSFLYLNDEPIAYNLGYLHQQHYFYLKTSYQERFRTYGVATLGRAKLIEQLIEQGVTLLDFPGEPYEWEQQWTESLCWHRSVAVYNRTLQGTIFYWMSKVKQKLNKTGGNPKTLVFCDAKDLRA